MLLYYAPGTCALACWIALDWAGADYSVEKVDPKSDAYRRVNPLGTVPAIDIGGERAMTQADAILQYIAERYSDRKLGAEDGLDARFEFNETMAFLTGDFHPAFWPHFTPERFTTDDGAAAIEAVKAAAQPRVERVLDHLDELIGSTGHVYRGRRTVADAYAFVMARWSGGFPRGWRHFPHVAAFMSAMNDDAAVKRVMEASNR
jgi:glutathione S-transferase